MIPRCSRLLVACLCIPAASRQVGCATCVLYGTEYEVSGTLVDEATGQPIADAPIQLQLHVESPRPDLDPSTVVTDASGGFSTTVPAGLWCTGTGVFAAFRRPPAPYPVSSVVIRIPEHDGVPVTVPVQQQSERPGHRTIELGAIGIDASHRVESHQ